MIKVTVDEAAAFDMLSILEIKGYKSDPSLQQYEKALDDLINQLGYFKVLDVIRSNEYKELVKANRQVFDYVDVMSSGDCICGLVVHEANMQRYALKKQLQAKFFNKELNEEKI